MKLKKTVNMKIMKMMMKMVYTTPWLICVWMGAMKIKRNFRKRTKILEIEQNIYWYFGKRTKIFGNRTKFLGKKDTKKQHPQGKSNNISAFIFN